MNTKTLSRKELIEYIRKNDSFYFGTSFEGHSEEQLVIIKTGIELKLAKKNRKQAVNDA